MIEKNFFASFVNDIARFLRLKNTEMQEDRRAKMMDGCPLMYITSKYDFVKTKCQPEIGLGLTVFAK